jgi:hypothetical protein
MPIFENLFSCLYPAESKAEWQGIACSMGKSSKSAMPAHPKLLGVALVAQQAVKMKKLVKRELPAVEATVKVVRLTAFDVKARTVNIDFVLMLDWIDPTLIGADADNADWENAFIPKVVIHNAATEMVADNCQPRIFDAATGWIRLSARYRGTLLVDSIDVSEYPFDRQQCLGAHLGWGSGDCAAPSECTDRSRQLNHIV